MPPEQLINKEVEGTPEERVSKTILLIKERCQGVSANSTKVEALGHIATLIGLSAEGLYGTGIINAIIERRRQDDGDYDIASKVFESLVVRCLGNDEKGDQLKTAILLSDKLHMLKEEINPKHS